MDINAMRQERAELAGRARAIMTGAEDATRTMTGDEEQEFDRLMDKVDSLERSIAREEKLREQERRMAADAPPVDDKPARSAEELAGQAWRAYLTLGRAGMSPELARALTAGSDPEGGYLVAPQQFVSDLIKKVDDDVPLRGLMTVQTLTTAASLGVPTLDTDLGDADWTSEVGTGSQDDAMRFGKRELTPHPLAKRVKASRKLLRLTANGAEQIVRDRLAYKFAVTQEKAYMTGDGNQKPLGLFTATSAGISTSRDVTIGSGGSIPLTEATADQLIDAKYALKAAYWRNARWLFHRDVLKTVRKLKTTDGHYIWRPGLNGTPEMIDEIPFVLSEYAPNTVSAGQYVGMLADFSYYWIAEALRMEVQRLVELYAEANQVGFIGRMELDGMPTLEEPFVRLKVGA